MAEESADSPQSHLLNFPDIGAKWIPVLTAYAVALGLLMEYGYWSAFDVPIMNYLGWTDVARVTSLPLLLSGTVTLLTSYLVSVFSHRADRHFQFIRQLPPEQRQTYRKRTRLVGYLVLASSVLLLLTLIWNIDHPLLEATSLLVSGIAGYLGAWWVTNSKQARFVIFLMLMALSAGPFSAYQHGVTAADKVANRADYDVAFLPSSALVSLGLQGNQAEIVSLGHVDDYDFFLIGKRTLIVRSTKLAAFQIQESKRTLKEPIRIPFLDPMKAPIFE